jgi:hypothetical protein
MKLSEACILLCGKCGYSTKSGFIHSASPGIAALACRIGMNLRMVDTRDPTPYTETIVAAITLSSGAGFRQARIAGYRLSAAFSA